MQEINLKPIMVVFPMLVAKKNFSERYDFVYLLRGAVRSSLVRSLSRVGELPVQT